MRETGPNWLRKPERSQNFVPFQLLGYWIKNEPGFHASEMTNTFEGFESAFLRYRVEMTELISMYGSSEG